MYFQICCICTSQVQVAFSLGCSHKYCELCLKNVHLLSKNSPSAQCPICLKSAREEPRYNPKYPSIKHQTLTNQLLPTPATHPHRKNKLYCFSCQVLFRTQEYLNGHHKTHRVKTSEEAINELQDQHLRSLKILESKSQQYRRKEITLENCLSEMYSGYQNTRSDIKCYFDNLVIEVERERDRKEMELEEVYNKGVMGVAGSIKEIQQSHEISRRLGKVIKQFCNGELGFEELINVKEEIKEQVQLSPVKITLPRLPKLIEINDAAFYIKNSLSFVMDPEPTLNDTIPDMKSQADTDIQQIQDLTIPRKVRLVEKVRNQLNPSCKFLKNDYFFEF